MSTPLTAWLERGNAQASENANVTEPQAPQERNQHSDAEPSSPNHNYISEDDGAYSTDDGGAYNTDGEHEIEGGETFDIEEFEEEDFKTPAEPTIPAVPAVPSKPLFKLIPHPDKDGWLHVQGEDYPKQPTERGLRSHFPPQLDVSRKLKKSELEEIGYHALDNDYKPTWFRETIGGKVVDLLAARAISTEELHEWGVAPLLLEAREMIADSEFRQFCIKTMGKAYLKEKGTKWTFGMSSMPGHQPKGIQASMLSKTPNGKVKRLTEIIAAAGQIVVDKVPGAFTSLHKKMFAYHAFLNCGTVENMNASSLQINFTPIADDLTSDMSGSIKGKAERHIDGADERQSFSVFFPLSYLPSKVYPGHFSLGDIRVTMTAAPITGLIFSGRHPHGGSGLGIYPADLPLDSELRWKAPEGDLKIPDFGPNVKYFRAAGVLYPRRDHHSAREVQLHPRLFRYTTGFGTRLNALQWRMLQAIKVLRNAKEKELGSLAAACKFMTETQDPQEWIDKFTRTDTGKVIAPDIEIAQLALSITAEDVKDWEDLHEVARANSAYVPPDPKDIYNLSKKRKAIKDEQVKLGSCAALGKKTGLPCKNYRKEGSLYCGTHKNNDKEASKDDAAKDNASKRHKTKK